MATSLLLGFVPGVGGALNSVAQFMIAEYPGCDLWGSIKDQVQELVERDILQYDIHTKNLKMDGYIIKIKDYLDNKARLVKLEWLVEQMESDKYTFTNSPEAFSMTSQDKHYAENQVYMALSYALLHLSVLVEQNNSRCSYDSSCDQESYTKQLDEMTTWYTKYFELLRPIWESWRTGLVVNSGAHDVGHYCPPCKTCGCYQYWGCSVVDNFSGKTLFKIDGGDKNQNYGAVANACANHKSSADSTLLQQGTTEWWNTASKLSLVTSPGLRSCPVNCFEKYGTSCDYLHGSCYTPCGNNSCPGNMCCKDETCYIKCGNKCCKHGCGHNGECKCIEHPDSCPSGSYCCYVGNICIDVGGWCEPSLI